MKEVAIITGASGGIGYEIALLFAQQKIDIVIVARNEKKLENIKTIQNCKMVSEKMNNKIKYTYILKNGISEIKGGINVLTEMNYPKEIIENTIKYNN
jgi:NADP-dependent 3-hydroxy acid dehydrogenase YdfG